MHTRFFKTITSCCPVFWKCLIKRYLAFFTLATLAIVVILLTSTLEDVAYFIAVGASFGKILLFLFYKIPYILQIAFPIGGFISGYAIASRMSQAGEITAMRSLGRSITQILTPFLAISGILSLITFLFLFDFAAKSHLATKKLEYDVRSGEPLALLQSGQFLNDHSITLELSGSLKTGQSAKNVLICMMPKGQERLTLALLVNANTNESIFTGETLTLFSTTLSKNAKGENNNTICIENAARKQTPTHYLHELTQKKKWKVGADHLSMESVLAVKNEMAQDIEIEKYQGKLSKNTVKKYGRFTSEPWRRGSLSLAIMTLTYVGAIFGISIQRARNPYQSGYALLPFFIFIGLYLMGKNIDEVPIIAILCFAISHIILLIMAKMKKTCIEQGIG